MPLRDTLAEDAGRHCIFEKSSLTAMYKRLVGGNIRDCRRRRRTYETASPAYPLRHWLIIWSACAASAIHEATLPAVGEAEGKAASRNLLKSNKHSRRIEAGKTLSPSGRGWRKPSRMSCCLWVRLIVTMSSFCYWKFRFFLTGYAVNVNYSA